MLPLVRVVCGDPGGAAAVAPVAALLQQEAKVRLQVTAFGQATDAFSDRGVSVERLLRVPSVEEAAARLAAEDARVLLTGTSLSAHEPEKPYIAAARKRGLPSIAVLDFWANYRERFSDATGDLRFLPDVIAVMDELAQNEMISAGIPAERILVTGAPHFDDLRDTARSFTQAERTAIRAGIGAGPQDLVVLFASAPVAAHYGERLGYTERTVAALLAGALDRLAKERRERIVLALRPHPREIVPPMPMTSVCRMAIAVGRSGRSWALTSDLVVGMFSALLVESCYLGRLALSLQPGLRVPDMLPTNRTGLSIAIYDEAHVDRMLRRALFDQEFRKERLARLAELAPPSDATRRVAELVYDIGRVQWAS